MCENGCRWKGKGVLRWRDDCWMDKDRSGRKNKTERRSGCHGLATVESQRQRRTEVESIDLLMALPNCARREIDGGRSARSDVNLKRNKARSQQSP